MFKRSTFQTLTFLLLAGAALSARADWYLDGESSRLSFVSTKNANVSEVQRFLVLHGKVDPGGKAEVEVELDSINSGIPLRDERMRKELFEIEKFPEALITTQIDLRQSFGIDLAVQHQKALHFADIGIFGADE